MKLVKERLFNKEQLDYILSHLYDAQRNIKKRKDQGNRK